MDPKAIIIYLLMETVVHIIFFVLNRKMIQGIKENQSPALNIKDVLKGLLERLFLIVGMLNGYPHVIIAFGALKIGTRIKDEADKVSNDYFLVGNLISILASIIYVSAAGKFL